MRRANSGDRVRTGKEAARTCEDAMRSEFWDLYNYIIFYTQVRLIGTR